VCVHVCVCVFECNLCLLSFTHDPYNVLWPLCEVVGVSMRCRFEKLQ
jgi:hypothetical protein